MLEKSVEQDNVEFARTLRIISRKLNFHGERSWPDRLFLFKGSTLFIEYKRPKEKPTPLQLFNHESLRKQGFTVHVVDDKKIGRKLIKEWYDSVSREVARLRPNIDQDQ